MAKLQSPEEKARLVIDRKLEDADGTAKRNRQANC
jgi:hypothetical protein